MDEMDKKNVRMNNKHLKGLREIVGEEEAAGKKEKCSDDCWQVAHAVAVAVAVGQVGQKKTTLGAKETGKMDGGGRKMGREKERE